MLRNDIFLLKLRKCEFGDLFLFFWEDNEEKYNKSTHLYMCGQEMKGE